MPKSRFKVLLLKVFSLLKVLIVAWMIGIANCVKQESKFMEDTFIKTELMEEQEDDEPFID